MIKVPPLFRWVQPHRLHMHAITTCPRHNKSIICLSPVCLALPAILHLALTFCMLHTETSTDQTQLFHHRLGIHTITCMLTCSLRSTAQNNFAASSPHPLSSAVLHDKGLQLPSTCHPFQQNLTHPALPDQNFSDRQYRRQTMCLCIRFCSMLTSIT